MKIKKSHFKLALLFLGLIIVAVVGFSVWNTQILGNLGTLNQFSFYLIIAFAFFAGLISFFSPCGLALFPAFIGYNMALMGDSNPNPGSSKVKILKIGLFSALGIITFFVLLGIIFSLLGAIIAPYIQVFQYIIAILFIVFGIMLIKRFSLTAKFFEKFRQKMHQKATQQRGYKGFYIFGFAYGLDIIGCLFPLISVIILIPIATGKFLTGISAFLSYSVALAVMMSLFAYFIAFSRKTLVTDVLKSAEKINMLAGIGLVVGGVALLSYYTFFGMPVG